MKPIISTFLDYRNAGLDTQLELFKQLSLSGFMMRRIGGQKFYQIPDEQLNLYISKLKGTKVIAVDPLIESFSMSNLNEVTAYNTTLEYIVGKVKKFNPTYFIYTIPKFDETINDYKSVVAVIKEQINIIRKFKLKVLIKFSDNHTSKMYRYILDTINQKHVEIIFDYVYLYKQNEAEITAYRILRNYIGMLIMEDIDKLGTGRVIGSSENIDVINIAKRFIKRAFEGHIILDSSLVELLGHANDSGWFTKLVSKKSKHDNKIYIDFIERYGSPDVLRVLKIQMAVLSLMFLNKKIALT